jgi:hypothetical protein
MGWENALRNPAVDAAATHCNWVAGFDGADAEATSREAVTWAAADAGAAAASNQPVLTVPAPATISFILLFDDSTDVFPNYVAGAVVDPAVVFTEAGTYTLTAMSLSVSNPA